MKKSAFLFFLFIVALFLFKASSSDSNNTIEKSVDKELVSISDKEEIAKN